MDFDKIGQEVLGTSITEEDIIEKYSLNCSAEDVIEEMLDLSIEFCSGCGTWLESCEIDVTEQNVICKSCTGFEED